MDIKEALLSLDSMDDDQWTGEGLPKVDVVNDLVEGQDVTRAMITEAAPNFTRQNMTVETEELKTDPEDNATQPIVDDTKPDPEDETEAPEEEYEPSGMLEKYLEEDPMIEQQFITYLSEVPKEELNSLESILIEQLAALEEAKKTAEDLRLRTKLNLAYTRNMIKRLIPDVSNQEAIQQFIAAQTASREKRANYSREVLKGVDLKSLDPRAPIDRAMARKTQRGGKRPVRS